MLNFKKPYYYIAISAILVGFITYLLVIGPLKVDPTYASANNSVSGSAGNNSDQKCDYKVGRMNGYKLIKPLLYVDPECESAQLDDIKKSIGGLIEAEKASGKMVSASFYLRIFSKGQMCSYNADERFHPASMNKVPVLITFMKMAEKNPGLLDQKFNFVKQANTVPPQVYNSKTIESGHSHTVRELLRYMIAYSDNEATTLLWTHMNFDEYNKTFTDLGLAKPSFKFEEQILSVKEYSTFFKVMYNASYLSKASSEFCFSLLSQSDFKEGLLKKIPAGTVVAHKFGECTYDVVHAAGEKSYGKLSELHESGVIYCGDVSYLLVVMTKGSDTRHLADVIGDVSAVVYNALNKANNAAVSKN